MMMHDGVQSELLPEGGAREPEGFLCPCQRHGEEPQSGCCSNWGETKRGGKKGGNTGEWASTRDPGAEECVWMWPSDSNNQWTERRCEAGSCGRPISLQQIITERGLLAMPRWNVFVYVTQNCDSITCLSEMKDWSQVTVETDPCLGVTRQALSNMMERIKVEVNRLSKSGK